jgi:hypothetical protein
MANVNSNEQQADLQQTDLSQQQVDVLLKTLKTRFEKNMHRHSNVKWDEVNSKLKANPAVLVSLSKMELTSGEPDVLVFEASDLGAVYCDCSSESPKGRRSICYDAPALESRKEYKPAHSALGMAAEMGIEILSEMQYRELQKVGEFDLKTSSWVLTPASIREKGGALFCDRRYGQVFLYHNGAESYYGVRGFRGYVKI